MAELNKVLSAIRNAEAVGDTPAVLRLTQLARDISAQDRAQQAPRESDYPEANKRLSGYLGTIPRGIAAGVAGLGESALTGASFLLPENKNKLRERLLRVVERQYRRLLGQKSCTAIR